ncbi:MAG: hypothetical protein NT027_03625 [Proteobacteria bacterium]|nr:hypothetical protein [Pseudomonadota bacterium]
MKSKTGKSESRGVKKVGDPRKSGSSKKFQKPGDNLRKSKAHGEEKEKAKPAPYDSRLNRNARKARDKFVPDPKDANTVNALREKLRIIQEYKKLLAKDGLYADSDDKELESNLIKQLIRIEKGLSPTKPGEGRKKVKKKKKPKSSSDDQE